jgi:prepilin-type N-terminal cleavage/methylation domain-containing protein
MRLRPSAVSGVECRGSRNRASTSFPHALRAPAACFSPRAFTLIELILVMAILTMAVSVTAPALSNFFRGRSLDSEARRLLALSRSGNNRAISEGIPMDLWIDTANGEIGLDAEPSFEKDDPHAVDFKLDTGIHIEIGKTDPRPGSTAALSLRQVVSTASVAAVHMTHPSFPTIRFLPDGSVAESSPAKVRLVARDGSSLWLVQTRDKLKYEIKTSEQ